MSLKQYEWNYYLNKIKKTIGLLYESHALDSIMVLLLMKVKNKNKVYNLKFKSTVLLVYYFIFIEGLKTLIESSHLLLFWIAHWLGTVVSSFYNNGSVWDCF